MRRLLPIAWLLLSLACASARPAPEQTVDDFVAAFNRLDADAVGALLADDVTAFLPMPQYRAKLTGRAAIVDALRPLFDAERARSGALHLTHHDLAIQRAGDAAVATFDVGSADVSSRRTLVLSWRGGRWRIVHLHASNLRP
jgi:ketosteroid isomerase-like protein